MAKSEPQPAPELPLDVDALARLDADALGRLARECWEAQPPDAEQAVMAGLDRAAREDPRHREARRLFKKFVSAGGRLGPTEKKAETNRLHGAIRLMAQRLFEMSVYDPALRCATACEAPALSHCPSRRDATHAACARSLVFPFLHRTHDAAGKKHDGWNINKTAQAIVSGFTTADLHAVEEDNARQVIRRFLSDLASGLDRT